MARRGFFAELQRQERIAQRERLKRERHAARHHATLVRNRVQAQKEAERARLQFEKAEAAEQRRLEKEARQAYIAAKEAEVEERNEELASVYEDIDTLLESTLSIDDYVDLTTLRVEVQHPPFDRTDLERPVEAPPPIPTPHEPILQLPEPPRGLAGFFGKRRHAEAVESATLAHEQAVAEWRDECRRVDARRQAAADKHASEEQKRLDQLGRERARYAEECRAREEDAAAKNRALEELIANLGYGTVEAVQEYISIVLSNSVYPEHFPVSHDFEFNPDAAELTLRVEIPEPNMLPTAKVFKYVKASDEIVETSLSQKQCRERYASAVHQIALRSFHEVFESDRRGLIRTISLEVGTTANDPRTGRRGFVPFVIAAAERGAFLEFELSSVVPVKTLAHLGAAVSPDPYSLVPAERAGVRRA